MRRCLWTLVLLGCGGASMSPADAANATGRASDAADGPAATVVPAATPPGETPGTTSPPAPSADAGRALEAGTDAIDDAGTDAGDVTDAAGGDGARPGPCPAGPYAPRPFEGDAVVAQPVCSGLRFSEGPVWVQARGVLLFSDFQSSRADLNFVGRIVTHTPGAGCTEFRAGIGTNGLALDNDGQVLACRHDDQSVSRVDPESGVATVLVANYQGTALSSPNDVTVRADGSLYFTDPAWQVGTRPELLPQRAYRRDPTGGLHVIDDIPRANGITLSPDGSRLYVSNHQQVRAYDLAADGSTGAFTQFADVGADGMAVDCAGNLYVTTGAVVRVHAADGSVLGEVRLPPGADGPTNVAFGGAQRTRLFITARTALHAVDLAIPGWPH